MAALRSENGNLMFPSATAAGYSADNWRLADGDARDVTAACDEDAFRCDNLGCIGTVKGKIVALIRHPSRARGGLPAHPYRHRAVHDRQEMPRGACHR